MTAYQLYLAILGTLSEDSTKEERETAKEYLLELYKKTERKEDS